MEERPAPAVTSSVEAWRRVATKAAWTTRRQRRLLRVYDKARGSCHLCGRTVPHPLREASSLTPLNFPTLDHMRSKSLGGTWSHGYRLAHAFCNSLRGSRGPTKRVVADFVRRAAKVGL